MTGFNINLNLCKLEILTVFNFNNIFFLLNFYCSYDSFCTKSLILNDYYILQQLQNAVTCYLISDCLHLFIISINHLGKYTINPYLL